LYVVHRPVGYQLEHWGFGPELFPLWLGSTIPRAALVMVVEIAASLVIAVASWHLYEKQFLKLKDRFPYGVRDRRGDQAPAVG
jgi:peptidoglycan/LPS O-acetylase OafA/YrhL